MRQPALAALCVLAAACGGSSPAAPSPSELQSHFPIAVQSADYVFHHAHGDAVDPDRQQAFHAWAIARLEVAPGRRIEYYKYRDRSLMRQISGRDTNGWADPASLTVHSVWPWDPHEAAHVLAGPLGQPTDFFNEGLAMAMSVDAAGGRFEPLWNNQSVHDWCAEALAAGSLPALAGIVESNAFRSRPDDVMYRTSGSFVRYLLDSAGIAPLKTLFAGSWRDASATAVDQRVRAAYGRSLSEAERDWHAFLRGAR